MFNNEDLERVSVPIRGFNDFNTKKYNLLRDFYKVSVPIRGFNDFNEVENLNSSELEEFPSPYGVLMILIKNEKRE